MKFYNIVLSVCTDIAIEADSKEEAIKIALDNFEDGKRELIDAININGFEAEIDEY